MKLNGGFQACSVTLATATWLDIGLGLLALGCMLMAAPYFCSETRKEAAKKAEGKALMRGVNAAIDVFHANGLEEARLESSGTPSVARSNDGPEITVLDDEEEPNGKVSNG